MHVNDLATGYCQALGSSPYIRLRHLTVTTAQSLSGKTPAFSPVPYVGAAAVVEAGQRWPHAHSAVVVLLKAVASWVGVGGDLPCKVLHLLEAARGVGAALLDQCPQLLDACRVQGDL